MLIRKVHMATVSREMGTALYTIRCPEKTRWQICILKLAYWDLQPAQGRLQHLDATFPLDFIANKVMPNEFGSLKCRVLNTWFRWITVTYRRWMLSLVGDVWLEFYGKLFKLSCFMHYLDIYLFDLYRPYNVSNMHIHTFRIVFK